MHAEFFKGNDGRIAVRVVPTSKDEHLLYGIFLRQFRDAGDKLRMVSQGIGSDGSADAAFEAGTWERPPGMLSGIAIKGSL
jgi:hypothetical protein